MIEIFNTLGCTRPKADPKKPWLITDSPFKVKDEAKAVLAQLVCQPSPLPELGEGTIWDERSRRLLFVDILGCRLFRFDPEQPEALEEHSLAAFSSCVTSVVPLTDSSDPTGNLVGVTVREGFAVYSFQTRRLTMLPRNPGLAEGERFNDGKVDTLGRYWAGTIARNAAGDPVHEGALYRRNLDGSVDNVLTDVAISNGISWTKDRIMYFSDTLTGKVEAFDYDDKSGCIRNRRTIIDGFRYEETGLPDGHCMDAEGMLWIACFNGGMVRRFNPATGELLAEAHVPAEAGLQVTSCAFGGDNYEDLYIATAHEDIPVSQLLEKGMPRAGGLFKVTASKLKAVGACAGMPVSRWFLPGAGRTPTCFCATQTCSLQ